MDNNKAPIELRTSIHLRVKDHVNNNYGQQ